MKKPIFGFTFSFIAGILLGRYLTLPLLPLYFSILALFGLSFFFYLRKKAYPISVAAFHLPKATSDKYKTMNAYFPRSDWNFLVRISENTGRSKTDLVRESLEEYLENQR